MTAIGLEQPALVAPKRSRAPLVVLALLVVSGGVFAWRRLEFNRRYVTTDNAQIDGHISAVAPRVSAFVSRVLVEDNQRVKAGDTLVVLDGRDFEVRVDQAQADLASVVAALGTRADVGQARAARATSEATAGGAAANIEIARASLRKAEAELERYRGLAAMKIVSALQFDQAQWAVDNARAMLAAAERQATAAVSQTDFASAGIRVAEARLAAARSALVSARLQLGYTVILAHDDGVVAKRAVEPGVLVAVGQSLMMIVPEKDVWVTANLKETQLSRVVIGNAVEFSVDAYPGRAFAGTVESLSPATGARFALLPPDNATGNFTKVVQRLPVRIAITGAGDPAHPLRPGMSVDVRIAAQ